MTLTRIKIQDVKQSGIGVNITDQVYDDGHWKPIADRLNRLNPKSIGILGAAQYPQARQRARELRNRFPTALIKFRHHIHKPPGSDDISDKGMWKLPPQEYVDNVIVAHGYHEDGLHIVTDNESAFSADFGETWKPYAEAQAQVLDLGVPVGARFAVLRTPTHWPMRSQLDAGELDILFAAVARNMGDYTDPKVILSSNAYYDESNTDALLKVKAMRDRFFKVTGREPVISLGEYGYDRNFTSGTGWRKVGLNGTVYINGAVDRFNKFLGIHSWTADLYCVGIGEDDKIKQFALGMEELDDLIVIAPTWMPAAPVEEPPVTEPPPASQPQPDEVPISRDLFGIAQSLMALYAERDRIDAQILEKTSKLLEYAGGRA